MPCAQGLEGQELRSVVGMLWEHQYSLRESTANPSAAELDDTVVFELEDDAVDGVAADVDDCSALVPSSACTGGSQHRWFASTCTAA